MIYCVPYVHPSSYPLTKAVLEWVILPKMVNRPTGSRCSPSKRLATSSGWTICRLVKIVHQRTGLEESGDWDRDISAGTRRCFLGRTSPCFGRQHEEALVDQIGVDLPRED